MLGLSAVMPAFGRSRMRAGARIDLFRGSPVPVWGVTLNSALRNPQDS
jgi:hypothetical protein